MNATLLQNRDYTLIIARTATDRVAQPPRYAERWAAARQAVFALARQCEALDPDGITMYVSCRSAIDSGLFKKHEHVTSATLTQVLEDGYPPQNLKLETILQLTLDDYFARKTAGTTKPNGEIILVILDGEPSDRMAVAKAIKAATHKIDSDEELGIGFVQIGEDPMAQGFLTALDDDLKQAGAKFDIVSTMLLDEIKPDCLMDFLLSTLAD